MSSELNHGEFYVYQSDNGDVKLQVRLENETLWLTQQMMAELFDCSSDNISLHLKNIYNEQELHKDTTTENFSVVRQEGNRTVNRKVKFYNLDAVISVGYRVKSKIATQFRIWATKRLQEYIVKGFVMDDERLKNPPVGDSKVPDYFDEMLERIRDIRSSERRLYLRVREIFAMAADYQPSYSETTKFFSVIQNKLHFAATHQTAAEIIQTRANHQLPNMGLSSWKSGEVRKADVTIAKNYLSEKEVDSLNRIVVMWLDYAEDQAKLRKQVFMRDWTKKLDGFLKFNERDVLDHAGKVTKKQADNFSRTEYDSFADKRRIEKENQGLIDSIKDLEASAKMLKGGKND